MKNFLKNLGYLVRKLFLILSLFLFISPGVFAGPSSGGTVDPAPSVQPPADNSSTAGGTVLPVTEKGISDCKDLMNDVNNNQDDYIKKFEENTEEETISDVLGCGIKTGSIRLWMIPYYIRYILEFIVGIAGLISVGGIVYGGYLYLFAGVSDAKDAGKKAILYGVIGLIMTLIAWAVVNIVIAVVTG